MYLIAQNFMMAKNNDLKYQINAEEKLLVSCPGVFGGLLYIDDNQCSILSVGASTGIVGFKCVAEVALLNNPSQEITIT